MHRVVHLTNTPLAGAPGRLTRTLQTYSDWDALCFVERDYKAPQAGIFSEGCVDLDGGENVEGMYLMKEALESASIIHIHNYVTPTVTKVLKDVPFDAPVLYHLHSPRREGPLYAPRGDEIGVPIRATLSVAQMHPRFYPDAIPIPNIVPRGRSDPRTAHANKVRILYAPAELRPGRWNGKACKELFDAMEAVSKHPDVEVVQPTRMLPSSTLERLRSTCDVTIDEIMTGGFHQVSLEGLQAGNAVVNGADEISMRVIMGWTGERPPFVISSPKTIADDIWSLIENRDRLNAIKEASKSYAERHLNPARLVQIYERLYHWAIQ